ncbi:MAG: zinc finger CCHC domain-containing protein, partial [Gaiellaceae bacterium]
MKQFTYATKGLDDKYTGDAKDFNTLSIFGREVKKHLKNSGMDSVFYFIDPVDKEEKMIIEHYSRFTADYVRKETSKMSDEYDLQNLQWSADFLSASLSKQQKANIAKFPEAENNGPLLWMHLVGENTMANERALQTLLFKLQKMAIRDYPGKNVQKCTREISEICQKLDAGNMLPTNINGILCGIFIKCSVPSFSQYFNYVRGHMKKNPMEYSWGSLITEADGEYVDTVTADGWLPTSEAKGMTTAVEGLKQKQSKEKDVRCHNCNEKGHYARNCPKDGKSTGRGNRRGKKKFPAWQSAPPNSGQSERKDVDGKAYYWCGICRHWWTSHGTSSHRGSNSGNSNNQHAQA